MIKVSSKSKNQNLVSKSLNNPNTYTTFKIPTYYREKFTSLTSLSSQSTNNSNPKREYTLAAITPMSNKINKTITNVNFIKRNLFFTYVK